MVAGELRDALGVDGSPTDGGVEFVADLGVLWSAVSTLRTPESIRVRIASFVASDFDTLSARLARAPWHAYLAGRDANVRVVCHKSKLYHSGAVEERARAALAATRLPHKPGADVHIRLSHDRVTVSVDATGEPAHRRGLRDRIVPGAMRETLAAAAIRAAGLGAVSSVWDPFCGAGTLGFEWLAAAAQLPTFGARELAMERWPSVRGSLPARVAYEPSVAASATASRGLRWYGADRSVAAVAAACANAEALGVGAACLVATGDFEVCANSVPDGTAVFSNLPYGKRVTGGVDDSLRRLGQLLRRRPDLRPAVFVHAHEDLAVRLGIPGERLASFSNRGIRVHLTRFTS
ncbi:MAG: RNA methyltransferase [Myxococcales bacterium]|nr:RNA methyltransferase [Myxococcales bacterium]MCB9531728.1 RNA methyltransferase [Myxococcales bacterium]MCB9534105.1 RNA methyltransferase [Myxococcales bacterium]